MLRVSIRLGIGLYLGLGGFFLGVFFSRTQDDIFGLVITAKNIHDVF